MCLILSILLLSVSLLNGTYNVAERLYISNILESDTLLGCLTDELYGDFTDEELTHLIYRRKNVRELMNKNLHRNEQEILYVPVVFHNLYKMVDGEPIHSYCDYIQGSTKPDKDDDGEILETNFAEDGDYTTGNDTTICNQRSLRSLEILNAQYLPSGMQKISQQPVRQYLLL